MADKWSADWTFDYAHRDEDFEYRTFAYERGEANGGPVDVVTVATPADVQDGWRRWAWYLVGRRSPLKDILVVIAGPEVRVQHHNYLPKGSMAPTQEGFDIHVVRVPAARFVPQDGETPRLGTLVGTSVSPVLAHILRRQEGAMPDSDFEIDPCRMDLARVTRSNTSADATHVAGEWRVDVQVVDELAPGAFDITVEPHPEAARLGTQSAFLVRVAHTANYEVSAMQRVSIAERLDPIATLGPLPFQALVDYFATQDRQARSLVEVERALLDDSAVAVQGLELNRAKYEPFPTSASFSLAETLFLEGVLAGVEMTPVVGSIFEFGHLTYAAVSGFDIYGRKVSQTDLILMGAFAVIGIVPGVPGHSSLRTYKEVGDSLTRKLNPEAASLVSLNPGPVSQFLKLLDSPAPPLLREAARKVPDDEIGGLVTALKKASKGGGPRQLIDVMAGTVLPRLDDLDMIGELPLVLFARAMGRRHPQALESVAELVEAGDDATVQAVVAAYNRALKNADPNELQRVASPEMWEEYTEAVREAVVDRLFHPDLGGFRDAVNDEILFREFLTSGYENYTKKKLGKNEGPRIALEWALKQRSNSRFHQAMRLELGPEYKRILEPTWRSIRYGVSASAARVFKEFMSGSPLEVGGQVYQRAVRLPYSEMRDLLRKSGAEIGESLGRLFETDHLLEKRFFPFLDGSRHQKDFTSLLVPKNPDVARSLLDNGVDDFLYIHSKKTAAMARYLPYGFEELFTAQQVFNAYQRVFVHELGIPFGFFDELTGEIFEELARGQGRRLSRAEVKDPRVLAARVDAVVRSLPQPL